ncbi:MAG: LysM peptidoglycan-binding domain-containing protein, partial [Deltaproteobacteria bacterium]|nr:LysM peptidoglycan-binding domain-containing protein [Deltaproteobacteria bacterium]
MKRALTIFSAALALTLFMALISTAEAQQTESYIVQQGDSANSIAKRFYGKANLGPKLITANRNFLSSPKKLTPGDKIYLFPEATLNLRKPVEMPPLPEFALKDLYETNKLLQKAFPKYITFVADVRGLGGTGVWRIRINRRDPITAEVIDRYYEVRPVGEIIASNELGTTKITTDGLAKTNFGRTLLSTGDNVMIRFTNDLAKILDSDTYDDPDPHFRTFPVYTIGTTVHEPDKNSANYKKPLGNIVKYKGNITIGARVEGTIPASTYVSNRTKSSTRVDYNNDLDPVTYVANITYVEDPIEVGDKVMVFVPIDP